VAYAGVYPTQAGSNARKGGYADKPAKGKKLFGQITSELIKTIEIKPSLVNIPVTFIGQTIFYY
jgi:hypothetical protein